MLWTAAAVHSDVYEGMLPEFVRGIRNMLFSPDYEGIKSTLPVSDAAAKRITESIVALRSLPADQRGPFITGEANKLCALAERSKAASRR